MPETLACPALLSTTPDHLLSGTVPVKPHTRGARTTSPDTPEGGGGATIAVFPDFDRCVYTYEGDVGLHSVNLSGGLHRDLLAGAERVIKGELEGIPASEVAALDPPLATYESGLTGAPGRQGGKEWAKLRRRRCLPLYGAPAIVAVEIGEKVPVCA